MGKRELENEELEVVTGGKDEFEKVGIHGGDGVILIASGGAVWEDYEDWDLRRDK